MLRIYSIDYKKYPFLANLKEIMESRWPGLSLEDLLKSRTGVIYERAIEILKGVIFSGQIKYSPRVTTEDEVVAFNIALMILSLIGNKWLRDRFAVSFAKYVHEFLKKEPPENIEAIARALGMDVRYDPSNCPKIPLLKRSMLFYKIIPFSINVKDYLKYAKRLINDPKYALINQIVDHGRVYVEKDILTRIIVEAIASSIQEKIVLISEVPSDVKPLIEELKKELGLDQQTQNTQETSFSQQISVTLKDKQPVQGVIDFDAFPPCMKNLVDQLKRGENLSHQARFTITAFLTRIGMDVDSILELFSNVPDFNEKIARYQIEHIAGLRGSRKQYLPYSCATMKSLGLCPLTEKDCNTKNPLVAYWKNLRLKQRKRERADKRGKEKKATS
ncbi:DNA primase large subunit PriL [Desulfurococcaceae archaeon MEX13E-LK6-19]|nr:DNA primase large subunit PriL [Desulfurococcaceae archaeon MEX13E-LK6-19]